MAVMSCSIAYTSDLKGILNERARGRDIHVMDDTIATKLQKLVSSRSPATTRKRKSNNDNGSANVDPAGTRQDNLPRITDALLPAVIHRARSVSGSGCTLIIEYCYFKVKKRLCFRTAITLDKKHMYKFEQRNANMWADLQAYVCLRQHPLSI
jgi:hypothetical protein